MITVRGGSSRLGALDHSQRDRICLGTSASKGGPGQNFFGSRGGAGTSQSGAAHAASGRGSRSRTCDVFIQLAVGSWLWNFVRSGDFWSW